MGQNFDPTSVSPSVRARPFRNRAGPHAFLERDSGSFEFALRFGPTIAISGLRVHDRRITFIVHFSLGEPAHPLQAKRSPSSIACEQHRAQRYNRPRHKHRGHSSRNPLPSMKTRVSVFESRPPRVRGRPSNGERPVASNTRVTINRIAVLDLGTVPRFDLNVSP